MRLETGWVWGGEAAPEEERATLELADGGGAGLLVRVESPFFGDPPPPGPPGPTAGLWEHEVVELFVAAADRDDRVDYTEIELSPHGHHLVLRFAGVRRMVEAGLRLDYRAGVEGDRWHGEATVPWSYLPRAPHRAAVFALHRRGDERRHLASVRLPGGRPDFHQPRRFGRVDLPGAPAV